MLFTNTNSSIRKTVIYDVELNNCGYYKHIENNIRVSRNSGRKDYHLLFVERGIIETQIDGSTRAAKNGDMIFIPPFTPQVYLYTAQEDSSYYWLHFDGTKVGEILKKFPFKHNIYPIKNISAFTAVIDKMLQSNEHMPDGFSFALNAQMQLLLVQLGQAVFYSKAQSKSSARMAKIAFAIKNNPEIDITNRELADKYKISEYHLIRIFKAETGYTPHHYRLLMLTEKAKLLLRDTELNINEVSYMLNVGDPLYFSRIFKVYTGMSPTEYRNSIRT